MPLSIGAAIKKGFTPQAPRTVPVAHTFVVPLRPRTSKSALDRVRNALAANVSDSLPSLSIPLARKQSRSHDEPARPLVVRLGDTPEGLPAYTEDAGSDEVVLAYRGYMLAQALVYGSTPQYAASSSTLPPEYEPAGRASSS